jgi:hypothetical protein
VISGGSSRLAKITMIDSSKLHEIKPVSSMLLSSTTTTCVLKFVTSIQVG